MQLQRIIQGVIKLSFQQKCIIPIISVILIFALFYRYDISYQYNYLGALFHKKNLLERKIYSDQVNLAELNSYQLPMQQVQNLIAFYPSGCHLALDNVVLTQQLILVLQQSGLIIKAVNPLENKLQDENNLAVFRIQCLGDYAALRIFLQKILSFPVQVIIEKCQIQKINESANLSIELELIITSWSSKPCHF